MANAKRLKFVLYFLGLTLLVSCGGAKIPQNLPFHLRFLDEYVIPKDLMVDSSLVGGLSDLDYDGTHFYAVCDQHSSPRIYRFSMVIHRNQIDTVIFDKVIRIPHKSGKAKTLNFDSEGLIYYPRTEQFTLSSEGWIKGNKNPFVVDLDKNGHFIDLYKLPDYFKVPNKNGLRNNGVFEGLCKSIDHKGIWVSNELPLKMDGPTAKLYRTRSPVRFTYFDRDTKIAKKQFAYRLGRLRKVPFLPFGMNGVSAILEYESHRFLVLERAFSAGHGRHGIRAMLYLADAGKATNTLHIKALGKKLGKSVIPAKKKLLFDFNSIRKKLTGGIVDNLEGMAFGPKLPNGHQSLIIISDNNFNRFAQQLNQVILLEIVPNQNL